MSACLSLKLAMANRVPGTRDAMISAAWRNAGKFVRTSCVREPGRMPTICCSASTRVLLQELAIHDLFGELVEIGVTHVDRGTSTLAIPLGFER